MQTGRHAPGTAQNPGWKPRLRTELPYPVTIRTGLQSFVTSRRFHRDFIAQTQLVAILSLTLIPVLPTIPSANYPRLTGSWNLEPP